MQKNKQKRHLTFKRVALADINLGRTGQVRSCYDDGSLGVLLDGAESLLTFEEKQLYFPDSTLGYNQPCFDQ